MGQLLPVAILSSEGQVLAGSSHSEIIIFKAVNFR
jgi:hypothetical protein